jgi:hypothetical protein
MAAAIAAIATPSITFLSLLMSPLFAGLVESVVITKVSIGYQLKQIPKSCPNFAKIRYVDYYHDLFCGGPHYVLQLAFITSDGIRLALFQNLHLSGNRHIQPGRLCMNWKQHLSLLSPVSTKQRIHSGKDADAATHVSCVHSSCHC